MRFELTIPLRVRRFSRPVLSTTQPPVRGQPINLPGRRGCVNEFPAAARREEVAQQQLEKTLADLQTRLKHAQSESELDPQVKQEVVETRRRRDAWLARRLATLAPAERDVLARAAAILIRVAE